jgi:hypothetical protein
MGMVQDITTYLQTQGVGTKGTDLFYAHMPDSAESTYDNVVCCFEYEGEPTETSGEERPGLHIEVRNTSYDTAYEKIKTIRDMLDGITNTFIGGVFYQNIHATTSGPIPLGMDEKDRHKLAINFSINKYKE